MYNLPIRRALGRALAAATLLLLTSVPPAKAQSTMDIFDISQGTVVTANSAQQPGFDVRDLLGGTFSAETGNAIFQDGHPDGYVHFVEFKTATKVKVTGLDLYASGDNGGASDFRDYKQFNFYAKNLATGTFDLIYSQTPTHPEAQTSILTASTTLTTPVIAQEFRAEFLQYFSPTGPGGGLGGPRIIELDGRGSAVPAPDALMVALTGIVSGLGMRGTKGLRGRRSRR